jgi:proliferating cell nuclear antigen
MRLEISNLQKADIFVQCFQHMKTFVDSINIVFKEEQMYVQCMDNSMVLIMELSIPSLWFDVYKVEQDITIGVSSHVLSKVISIRDKSQTITWNTENLSDKLSIKFHAENSKLVFDKEFEIPLIDLETELLSIPATEYPAEFTLPCSVFANMINQLKQFGETLHIECTEEHIQMISDSPEFGKMNTHMPIDDLEEYAINEGQTVDNGFALRYLSNVCLYQKISKSLFIGVSGDFPMKLQFQMDENAQLVFYLAPKINDDEL